MIPKKSVVGAALFAAVLMATDGGRTLFQLGGAAQNGSHGESENLQAFAQAAQEMPAIPVTISVDAGQVTGKLNPIWRWEGYDEANYTYLPYGKKLVGQFT